MQCLQQFEWVKLARSQMPEGKGIMGAWARLASRAAFRKGNGRYCGHSNPVTPGMWAGGIVGLKSILGIHNRTKALALMDDLARLGFIRYDLDAATKKLTYEITDWVVQCSGAACLSGAVYTTAGYGFLCLPRSITQRLADQHYHFEEADAWLDLWCHSVYQDPRNAFSFLAPAIQYGKYGAIQTLEALGHRWGWEKTKVWRFFQKHGDVFPLYRLPSSYGCLIFNRMYPIDTEVSLPSQEAVLRILNRIRIFSANTRRKGSEHAHLSRMVAWYSKFVLDGQGGTIPLSPSKNRVALSALIYISLCRNCRNCDYDCRSTGLDSPADHPPNLIPVDLTTIMKECFDYEQPEYIRAAGRAYPSAV